MTENPAAVPSEPTTSAASLRELIDMVFEDYDSISESMEPYQRKGLLDRVMAAIALHESARGEVGMPSPSRAEVESRSPALRVARSPREK